MEARTSIRNSPTKPRHSALIENHPFLDGNKRVGHAALEVLLMLNGSELDTTVDEAERTILAVAAGQLPREAFTEWVRAHIRPA